MLVFDYGQRHKRELEAAVAGSLGAKNIAIIGKADGDRTDVDVSVGRTKKSQVEFQRPCSHAKPIFFSRTRWSWAETVALATFLLA